VLERIEKPWGHEEILEKTDKYVVKKLFVKAGRKLSYQYHNDKLETMFLLSGDAILILDGIRYICIRGSR
jgi:mannose-6-phosphate isomerase-like protein (cupin superfamily)